MSTTPAQKFVCPRCRTAFSELSHFCRECGADMQRASALEAAAAKADPTDEPKPAPSADRRLNDSNAAWLGKIVDGRYRVLEVIGRGGMGVVYRVEHLRMGKVAAMKVLHRDLASDPDVIARFEREAAAVSKLHHPHTVQVFDFGTANGALYLIMEYVRGLDLASIISRDGPLPWSRAAPLLAQICGALQEAHELGIVHRDLKPENVLITRTHGRDYAKVLDFGLAKLEQPQAPAPETDKQQIVGTPYFMAPEQIRGDEVDARSDLYSAGALMFEVLTGEHVFTGTTAVGVLTKHLTAEPDAPSMRAPKQGIDPRVDAICKKALAKDPAKRWRTANELAEAIEEVYAETVEYATGPGSRSSSRIQRRPLAVAAIDDHESDVRLRRSDIDAYERGLKRARFVTLGFVLVLVLGAGAGGAWYVTRPSPALTEEHEPNDDVTQANKIAAGTQVTGYVGKRRSPTQGDRDVFVVPWAAGTRRVVSVRVTGIANLDLALGVNDGDGLHGATADEAQVGGGEALHRRAIDGPLVVTIDEVTNGKSPVENVSDPYTLTVSEDDPNGEVEPNNTDADANPLEPTRELRGYLDTRGDIDMLRWMGEPGTYTVIVRPDLGTPALPLVWKLEDGQARTPGAARVQLTKGELIRLERSDRDGTGPLAARDTQWSVVVTP
ncbi:MAG TPA: serine/threonine-protein kinase [Kofleriaceae bacterium]